MEKDKETKATEEREGSQVNQNVVDFGSAMTKTAHGTVYTLAIIGQIEGHTAAPNGTKTTQYEQDVYKRQVCPLMMLAAASASSCASSKARRLAFASRPCSSN